MADSDSDDDLFAEEDGSSAAQLFGVMHLLDECTSEISPESLASLLASEPLSISLCKQAVGDTGVALLATALTDAQPSATVTILSLDENEIGDTGAEALARACPMKVLPALEELHMSSNRIGAPGMHSLASKLPSTLTACDFSGNPLGDAGVAALGSAIALVTLTSLSRLYLDRTGMHNDGCAALARAAAAGAGQTLPMLSELWLSNNHIGDDGAVQLFNAIGGGAMPSLGDLRLQFNELGDASAAALVAAAGGGAGLARTWYLGLSNNRLTDAALGALTESITAGGMARLEFITVNGDAISAEAEQGVQGALTKRRRG